MDHGCRAGVSIIALPEIAANLGKIHSMLVLTRKVSQVIKLGDQITLTVVRTSNGSVKLGIDAPRHIRIMRAECDVDETCYQTAEPEVG